MIGAGGSIFDDLNTIIAVAVDYDLEGGRLPRQSHEGRCNVELHTIKGEDEREGSAVAILALE